MSILKLNFARRSPPVLDFSPPVPRCYVRDKTHTYIWLRDKGNVGVFLTMDSGVIEVVKARLQEGHYHVNGHKEDQLYPIQHDLLEAVKIYHFSTLSKTPAAQREIGNLLGLDTSGIIEDPAGAEVKKPVTEKKEKTASTGGTFSLAELCAELGIEPSVARKKLRGKVEKPGGRWEWPTQGELDVVRGYLV